MHAGVRQTRDFPLTGTLVADSGWFDVDTVTVLTRCYKTLIPKEDYVAEVLNGMPDLYGATDVHCARPRALLTLTRVAQDRSGCRRA